MVGGVIVSSVQGLLCQYVGWDAIYYIYGKMDHLKSSCGQIYLIISFMISYKFILQEETNPI